MAAVVHAYIDGRDRFYRRYDAEGWNSRPEWQVTITSRVTFNEQLAEQIASQLAQAGWAVRARKLIERVGPRGGLHIEMA